MPSAASTFDFSRHSYLYTAAELGIPAGSNIVSVEWDKANTFTTTGNATFSIYMKNSAAVSLANNSWTNVIAGATQVYTSTTQTIAGTTGFQMFTLGTSFVYSGGNLEISTDWDISAVGGNPSTGAFNWYYTAAPGMAIGIASGTAAGVANLQTTTYGNNRPNIRITYVPGTPCSGTPLSGTASAHAVQHRG